MKYICSLFVVLLLAVANSAVAKPTWEDFGAGPQIRSLAISPNGERVALLNRRGEQTILVVIDLITGKPIGSIDTSRYKARYVYFASDNHVILFASETQYLYGYSATKIENTNSYVYNIEKGYARVLLRGSEGVNVAQTGVGGIEGVNLEKDEVYMAAFSSMARHLYRVELDSGRGRIHRRGNKDTDEWIVTDDGKVLAREDYLNEEREHRIYSYLLDDEPRLIYSEKIDRPKFWIVAAAPDKKSLLVRTHEDGELRYMDLSNGELSSPVVDHEGRHLHALLLDKKKKLLGSIYSGLRRTYEFVDPGLNSLFANIEAAFPKAAVFYVSHSTAQKRIVVRVEGSETPPSYYLYDGQKRRLSLLGKQFANIAAADVGEVRGIKYKARDGLDIPALLTMPSSSSGVNRGKNLPLIVLPHGGPESHDYLGFDWWAHYFASQGYAVLQPNFRGSSGFGKQFTKAGHGKWGQEMQDDVSDGVMMLAKQGIVDPDRVCIMGASYGGYSALAGAAFSPELYRCVVSVAGVSDLVHMMQMEQNAVGRDHWVLRYWEENMKGGTEGDELLKRISPARHADKINAPVLLLHGKDDTVVPYFQSKHMYKKLKKAKKKVELISLKGEDHWLSRSATRQQMLKAIDEFVKEHNPPG